MKVKYLVFYVLNHYLMNKQLSYVCKFVLKMHQIIVQYPSNKLRENLQKLQSQHALTHESVNACLLCNFRSTFVKKYIEKNLGVALLILLVGIFELIC